MRAVVQSLHPVSVPRLPPAAPGPSQGQHQRRRGPGHVPPSLAAPTIASDRSSSLGDGTRELCASAAATCCSRAGVTAPTAVVTPHQGVKKRRHVTLHPEQQRTRDTRIKQFSEFGQCFDGRRGLEDFMKCLRLASAPPRAVRMSLR